MLRSKKEHFVSLHSGTNTKKQKTWDKKDVGPFLVCKQCLNVITSDKMRIVVNGANTHTFANPHGFFFPYSLFFSGTGLRIPRGLDRHLLMVRGVFMENRGVWKMWRTPRLGI